MRRLVFLLSVLFLFSEVQLFAQSLEAVDWGGDATNAEETAYLQFVGSDNNAYYFIHSDKKVRIGSKIYLDKFSALTNEKEASAEIVLPLVQKKKTRFEALYYRGEKFILFTSLRDNDRKQKVIYVSYLNEDGTLKNKPIEIDAVALGNGPGGLNIFLSEDKQAIVLVAYQPIVKYKGQEIHVSLIDFSLMKMAELAFVFPESYNDRTVRIKQISYTKKGDVVLLGEVEKPSKKKPRKGVELPMEFNHFLMIYNAEQEQLKDFVISAAKNVIADARFTVNRDNKIIVAGLIRGGKDVNVKTGFFYKRYDPALLKELPNLDPKGYISKFSRDLSTVLGSSALGKTIEERYSYKVNSVEELQNGTYIVLTEQYAKTYKKVKGPKGKYFNLNYYYNGAILAACIGKTGKFDWVKLYPKKQRGTNDRAFYSSYALVKIKNKLKLFYNDNSSNLEKGIPVKKIKEFKDNIRTTPKGIAAVLSIYRDGSYEIDPMFPQAEDGLVILPKTMGKTKNGFVIISQNGTEYKAGAFIVE